MLCQLFDVGYIEVQLSLPITYPHLLRPLLPRPLVREWLCDPSPRLVRLLRQHGRDVVGRRPRSWLGDGRLLLVNEEGLAILWKIVAC